MRRSHPLWTILSTLLLAACGGGGSGSSATSAANGIGIGIGNAPTTSTVSGTVLDAHGAPVAGATVSVFSHNDHDTVTATTDGAGRYAIAGLHSGANSDYAVYADKAGFGFVAAVADAAGVVDRFDFNGLYRTVIRFATMPAHDVAGADFTALRAGDRLATLARTGQAASYAAGDDGALGRGVAWPGQRFVDNGDGTVRDQLTGLVWTKNAGCLAPMNWGAALAAANALASGACGLADGSTAGQWRLPNANELESLIDVAHSAPALPSGHPFSNVDLASAYWTSTTYMASQSQAMAIRLADGRWINGTDAIGFDNDKTSSSNAVWAVRSGSPGSVALLATGVYSGVGGEAPLAGADGSLRIGVAASSARFVDNGDGTLADTVTGLTWLKKADCLQHDWAGALAAVNGLASGQCGLSDGSSAGQWRVPNRAELLSLSDRAPTFPQAAYFDGVYGTTGVVSGPVVFSNYVVSEYYWTSSTDAADPSRAWALYSCDFGVYDVAKTELRYTLAVR